VKGNDENDWIILDRTETGSRCRIPNLSVAQQIMLKYKDHSVVCSSNKILPVLSNQKMNSYLNELADVCETTKNLLMHVSRHTSLKATQIYARLWIQKYRKT
jgi:hypothetical protein